MKKIINYSILAGIALSLASCVSTPRFIQHAYFVDYQQAAGGKVFITESNSVSFDYTPVGSLLVEEIAGMEKKPKEISDKQAYKQTDPIYGDVPQSSGKSYYRFPDAESALDYAAKQALDMGGDAIINLQMVPSVYEGKRQMLIVKGMVVKRK